MQPASSAIFSLQFFLSILGTTFIHLFNSRENKYSISGLIKILQNWLTPKYTACIFYFGVFWFSSSISEKSCSRSHYVEWHWNLYREKVSVGLKYFSGDVWDKVASVYDLRISKHYLLAGAVKFLNEEDWFHCNLLIP